MDIASKSFPLHVIRRTTAFLADPMDKAAKETEKQKWRWNGRLKKAARNGTTGAEGQTCNG